MKQITVELQTSLKRLAMDTDGRVIVTLEHSATVRDALDVLGLIHGEVGLVLIDDRLVDDETQHIPAGSVLKIYPIFGGG
jgi:hypothetical protein